MVVLIIAAVAASVILTFLTTGKEPPMRSYCANNLGQFARALYIYANEYKYFPPHNPYPSYWPGKYAGDEARGLGLGMDPSIGWLMTCGMRMSPPVSSKDGHFRWFVLSEDELPEITICPAANRNLMFRPNAELGVSPWESFVYQYAAFYQTSG